MPSKFIIIVKSIARKWFIFIIIIILIVAYVEWIVRQTLIIAIVLTIIFIALFILHYAWTLYSSKRLEKFLVKHKRIDDKNVARKLKQSLSVIQEDMFELSQKQHNKNWLITYSNKQYIFYHEFVISKFNQLYKKGYGDKEILEYIKEYNLETRAEIKSIEDTLIKYNRLSKRKISVKERREKERFQDL